jgi:mannose/fructose/N-acetylgalactosamine-specific phosphotransferase system component IID
VYVVLDHCCSPFTKVIGSIPAKGSVLGPILFFININDIHTQFHCLELPSQVKIKLGSPSTVLALIMLLEAAG